METKEKNNAKSNDAKLAKLKVYVINGEYQKIDEWFEKNKISENQKLEDYIVGKLLSLKENPFLSFKKTLEYNIKQLNFEKTETEIAILKNLSFENQLKLLFYSDKINPIKSDHFKVIKITHENRKILESNKKISSLVTIKFATEDFIEIDKIQEALGFNVMNQKVDMVTFCYDVDSYIYEANLPISKPIFSPKYDIIFNYSEEKQKFLEERNIALPTIEEANSLYYEMKEALKKNASFSVFVSNEYLGKELDKSFKKYEVLKLNLDLENELKIKNNTKKKIKI